MICIRFISSQIRINFYDSDYILQLSLNIVDYSVASIPLLRFWNQFQISKTIFRYIFCSITYEQQKITSQCHQHSQLSTFQPILQRILPAEKIKVLLIFIKYTFAAVKEYQKMNNKLSEEPCIYYDAQLNQSRFRKPKKNEKKINEDSLSAKKNLRQKKNSLNQQYFPSAQSGQDDSSHQSNVTEKIKNISRSSVKGVRPKPTLKSASLSQKSTKKQLCNQITKLEQALQNKNRALIKFHSPQKIKQVQVMELYRVINFYEGKIKHLQQQIKRYEEVLQKIGRQCDQKSRHKSEVQQMVLIFEDMRKENTNLSAKIEQKDYTIGSLEQKAHKLQIKLNFMTSKSSFLKKSTSKGDSINSSKSKLLQSLNSSNNHLSSAISGFNLKQKQENYGNIQSKINKIQVNLNFLKKENQKLYAEIQEKQLKIFQMEKDLLSYKQSKESSNKIQNEQPEPFSFKKKQSSTILMKEVVNVPNSQKLFSSQLKRQKYSRQDFLNKTTVLPVISKSSSPLHLANEVDQAKKQQSQIREQSQVESQSASQGSLESLIQRTKKAAHTQTFKKLKYQLLTSQISFEQLIKFLVNDEIQAEILEEPPYNLKSQQAEHLIQWINELAQVCSMKQFNIEEVLKAAIPKFENLTFKKENTFKIQIANEFSNREKQFDKVIEGKEKISFKEMEEHLQEWGLSQGHVNVLCKSYYEKTGEVQLLQVKIIRSIMENWGPK